MLIFEGQVLDGPGRIDRIGATLSGTCYSPKVFDLSLCEFWPADCAHAKDLVLPALVRLRTRQTRISDRFQCVDTRTSSEFAALVDTLFCKVRVFKLSYNIPATIDATLLWSRVWGAEDFGIFWQEGQKKQWGARCISATDRVTQQTRLLTSMRSDDPFAEDASGGTATATKRRRTCGDGQRGRGGPQAARQQAATTQGAWPCGKAKLRWPTKARAWFQRATIMAQVNHSWA